MISLIYLKRRLREYFELKKLKKLVHAESVKNEFTLHFLISPGRSGSTLLRKYLLENTEIHIPPESSSLIIDISRFYLKAASWEEAVDIAVNIFSNLLLNKFWRVDINTLGRYLLNLPTKERNLRGLLVHIYKFHSIPNNPNSHLFADKTPFLSQDLKWLSTLFSESKFLFLFRDPYAVTYSRMVNFNETLETASSKWVWAAHEYEKYGNRLNSMILFYEDLITNFEITIGKVAIFFGTQVLSNSKIVDLGEDHLNHHKRLQEKIKPSRDYKFNQMEMKKLKKKFCKVKSQILIEKYNLEYSPKNI